MLLIYSQSVDLTRITSTPDTPNDGQDHPTTEYSAREVASSTLLLQQLLRAHRTFLLHHGASLSELYVRITRSKFCSTLKRYWHRFIYNWDILLNGNPALGLFNGLKLAAGGELGVGVGEEEWGSGEREVLEAFIGRTEGLVDMTVSRFGNASASAASLSDAAAVAGQNASAAPSAYWQADGQHPRPSDGVVFSGIGAISRTSIRDISCWAEDLFRYGQDTYGVRDNPSSMRWRRRGKIDPSIHPPQAQEKSRYEQIGISNQQYTRKHSAVGSRQRSPNGHGIPLPIVGTSRSASQPTSSKPPDKVAVPREQVQNHAEKTLEDTETGTETMMRYLTLGVYGSKWGIPFKRSLENPKILKLREDDRVRSNSPGTESSSSRSSQLADDMPGYFLIGFHGDLDSSIEDDEQDDEAGEERADRISDENQRNRTMLRTLYVRRLRRKDFEASGCSEIEGTSTTIITPMVIRDSLTPRARHKGTPPPRILS